MKLSTQVLGWVTVNHGQSKLVYYISVGIPTDLQCALPISGIVVWVPAPGKYLLVQVICQNSQRYNSTGQYK